jgi:PKD repeat protein
MSGALPPGLTLNASTGIISGTPTLAGTYTFTVHASGSTGGSDDQTLAIFITGDTPDNHPPTAEATAIPESGTAPLTVSFDGILSSDPDGVITDYTWDFGNNQTGTGETVSHTYTAAGTYTATLTVTDNGGLTDTDSVTISVTENVNEPPTAVDDSASTLEDTAVTIDVCANDSDPDGDEISVISVQCSENGNAAINNDSTITYISNPDFNGTDTFIYTISDGNNNTDTATVTVNITPVNDRPAAIASAAPISGDAPLAVSFTGTGSDPDNDTITYSWNFGDGHTSAAMSPSHTYESAGTYTAVLTVSDSILADEDSVLITVTEPGTEGQVTLKALDQHGENVTGAEILIYQDSGWVAYNSGSKVELDVGRRYLVKGRVMEHTGPYTWETIQEDTAEIIVPFQKFSFNAKDQNDNVISDAEITIYNISNIFSAGDTITLPTDTKMYIRTKRLGVSGPLNTVTATGSMNEYTALLQTVILGAEDQYSISVDDAEIFVYGVNTPFSPGDTVTLPLDSNPLIRGRRLDVYGSLEKINFSADRTAYNVPFRKVTFAARDQDGNDLTGAEIFISGMSGSFPSGTQLTLAQGASLYVNAKYNGEYCGSWQRLVIEQDLDEKVFMFELQ